MGTTWSEVAGSRTGFAGGRGKRRLWKRLRLWKLVVLWKPVSTVVGHAHVLTALIATPIDRTFARVPEQ